jgi:Fic family protein
MKHSLQRLYKTTTTAGETVAAFVPKPLPPDPPIDWTSRLREAFDQALLALGRLDSVSQLLPDTSLFLNMYIRKEAVLSSMIEGTQSSLSDLLLFELDQIPGVPLADVQEVSNYVEALNFGMSRLKEGFPLSLRLFRDIHAILLSKGSGSSKMPGEFRKSQNWIGGTRPGNAVFVPPPPEEIMNCMGSLELFLHDIPEPTPVLLKAALAHVQIETIHPFLDGNGRLGRLMITLLLCEQGVLREPLLDLSLYFKQHRSTYYELLEHVRHTGDWESWLEFFAEAVRATATQAVETARRLADLARSDREKITEIGRPSTSVQVAHRALLVHPFGTASSIAAQTGLSLATATKTLRYLEQLGIVNELTGKKRNRIYTYSGYLDILNKGTELSDMH